MGDGVQALLRTGVQQMKVLCILLLLATAARAYSEARAAAESGADVQVEDEPEDNFLVEVLSDDQTARSGGSKSTPAAIKTWHPGAPDLGRVPKRQLKRIQSRGPWVSPRANVPRKEITKGGTTVDTIVGTSSSRTSRVLEKPPRRTCLHLLTRSSSMLVRGRRLRNKKRRCRRT